MHKERKENIMRSGDRSLPLLRPIVESNSIPKTGFIPEMWV